MTETKTDTFENTVFIGDKEIWDYIYAVQTQSQKFDLIHIKARGRNISKAADVAEICCNQQLKEFCKTKINLYSETYTADKKEKTTSVIEIVLQKKTESLACESKA